jgi:hypothetical protein
LIIPLKEVSMTDWLKETYEHVKSGGRVPDHPLKRHWPKGFEGTFEDYCNFSVPVDPLHYLERKPLLFKSLWVNATRRYLLRGCSITSIRKWNGPRDFNVCPIINAALNALHDVDFQRCRPRRTQNFQIVEQIP